MQVPNWLQGYLRAGDLEKIRLAIETAEKRTSAEIVPMIVRESTRTGHVVPLVFFAALAALWGVVPYVAEAEFIAGFPYWGLEIGAVLIAALLAWGLGRMESVRRMCTPHADQVSSALMRANLEFYECGIKRTEGRNGVLIFVSLLEHQAVVLADQAIADKLPPETWQGIVNRLVENVRQRDFTGGMCAAIESCGERLETLFPRRPDDRDELPNRLLIEE